MTWTEMTYGTTYEAFIESLKHESLENRALMFAERYGTGEYYVRGNYMISYHTYPLEHATYRATIDLRTMEETREEMSRYYKPWKYVGGRYQVNLRG